ncbi:polycystin-1-like protein 2 [Brachyhypopomus gauderio]|uniref:polycystin-1-like protein 2 n=1 Tax=Brachyhypopomus gauderio TaxID=698409 RepID=UPI004041CC9F
MKFAGLSTMALLRQIFIYCWISGTFLATSDFCGDNSNGPTYTDVAKCVLENICYEFAMVPQTWAQARDTCENRGGKLLRVLDCKVKQFLLNLSVEVGATTGAWWVSKPLMGLYMNTSENAASSNGGPPKPPFCTYVTMDPFQLMSTSNCNMALGHLCTLDFEIQVSSPGNTRKRREANQDPNINNLLGSMKSAMQDPTALIEKAINILSVLETELVQISPQGQLQYLQNLYNSIQFNGPEKYELIVNCTGGMLMYSLEQCNNSSQPPQNYGDLLDVANMIYEEISQQMLVNGTDESVLQLVTGTLYGSRRTPQQMDGMLIGSTESGPYFQLPSFSAMQSQLPDGLVTVQLMNYNMNPLSQNSNESITGSVCSLSLKSKTSDINLNNLTDYIEMFLPRDGVVDPTPVNMSLKEGFAVITSFDITDTNSTVLVSATPDQNVSLQLRLSQAHQSNLTSTQESTVLNGQEDYRWLITPEMLEGSTGTWHVSITLNNSNSSQPVTISLSLLTFKCMFWDTVQNEWSIFGCKVGPKSMPSMTHCLCNHNTIYGSSFFVMPNHVDLSQTAALFATVQQNYVVVVVLSAFFFLYLIIVMWAWYADRRALRTRKMTLLEDNHPCASYNYLLNIQTGNRSGAGTSAKVMIILEGTEGVSKPHHLSDPDKLVFEKGGVDMFLLSCPFPLGELQSVKLWHDNSGGHPDWYLNKVTVQDLQTRNVWHFLCSTWLNSTGDSTCARIFNPAKMNEIASFGNIFHTRTSTGFRDEHIWISVVDPPRHSPFTRVQRVSCCMSLLLCTMAINIMFWNIPKDGDSPVIFKIGSYSLTWQQIMVAVESALLMFPINILIVTIFRSIKPRILDAKDEPKTGDRPSAVSIHTILKDTQDILDLLSRSPKNQTVPMQQKPESSADLFSALNQLHDLIHIIQGEGESSPHWAHCSRFVFCSLCHLALLLEKAGEKSFLNPEELQLARNTVSPMLKMAEMVFVSHTVQSPAPVPAKEKKQGCKLPWWFVFVGWTLLLGISGVSTFFTLIYGFQYGKESSIQWVVTLTLSLFQSIFIIQPLKVVGLAIFFALILRPVAVEDNEEVELLLQEQRRRCEVFCGRHIS